MVLNSIAPHVHIAHLYKAENAVSPSPEPPPLSRAALHPHWSVCWAVTRPSLWDRSGLAFAPGWFGCRCARSVRSWKAAGPSRGVPRWQPCSRRTRARWAPAGWGSAGSAGSWAAAPAARCCCCCWSSDSWGEFALQEMELWLAGWAGAGSGAQQRQGGLRRGVRASEEILMAGSERHAQMLHHIKPPVKKLSYPKLDILNFTELLHF